MTTRERVLACAVLAAALQISCGGGSDSSTPLPAAPPVVPPPLVPLLPPVALPPLVADAPTRISSTSPYATDCTGGTTSGIVYRNAEVEPQVAVNPRNPDNWVVAWQQDRWSTGSANGVVSAATFDGGATWTTSVVPFSRCAGGNSANGGDYERATDPWVSFAPDGTVFQMVLAVEGSAFTAGGASAMLVSRSSDGGRTWSAPSTLLRDGALFFNDKNSITADPTDARLAYAVWDRLGADGGGPAIFARTTDGGATWEAARPIYDPGPSSQTIGNVIAVLPDGTLANLFTRLDFVPNSLAVATLNVLLSSDQGSSWTGPFRIAEALAVGARDPDNGTLIRDGATLGQIAVAPSGHLWVTWQDARFSNGAHDGIALARSTDGGRTWSAPVQVNSAPATQAFTPSVHVLANGTIGVTYYDLRSNQGDPTTLLTDLILARSSDGAAWTEHRISTTFDLASAPVARGLFLGDYQGLAGANNAFIPVYVRTNGGDLANRTDVFALATRSLTGAPTPQTGARALRAASTAPGPDPAFRQRVHENIVQGMERRLPGWSTRFATPPR
jgi:hypothetical protein